MICESPDHRKCIKKISFFKKLMVGKYRVDAKDLDQKNTIFAFKLFFALNTLKMLSI
jgi:hypothetical protein